MQELLKIKAHNKNKKIDVQVLDKFRNKKMPLKICFLNLRPDFKRCQQVVYAFYNFEIDKRQEKFYNLVVEL